MIEAARAGHAGLGGTVVAEEMINEVYHRPWAPGHPDDVRTGARVVLTGASQVDVG
jgi:hypothetical protein